MTADEFVKYFIDSYKEWNRNVYGRTLYEAENPIDLVACYAGKSKNGVGQRVSDLLGVEVRTARGETSISAFYDGVRGLKDPENIATCQPRPPSVRNTLAYKFRTFL